MRLLEIHGKNVGILSGEFRFEFSDALTTIVGPIGSGKSTILHMIKHCLGGSMPDSAPSWVSHGIDPSEPSYFVGSWLLRGLRIDIAKPLKSDSSFTNLNIPRLKISRDGVALEEYFTASETNARIAELLDIPTKVIDTHLVVGQEDITKPVTATGTKFVETIHYLTRASTMDKVRSFVREALSSYSVPDVTEDVERAKHNVSMCQGELTSLEYSLSQAQQEMDKFDINKIQHEIEVIQELKQAHAARERNTSILTTLVSDIATTEEAINKATKSLEDVLQPRLKELMPEAEEARSRIAHLGAVREQARHYQSLENAVQALVQEKDGLVEPTPPSVEKPDDKTVLDLGTEFNSIPERIRKIEDKISKADIGICSECGGDYQMSQEERDLLTKEIESNKERFVELRKVLDSNAHICSLWSTYDKDKSLYEERLSSWKARSSKALQALKDAEKVVEPSEEEVTKLQAIQQSFVALEMDIRRLESSLQSDTARLDILNKQKDTTQATLDGLPQGTFSQSELDALEYSKSQWDVAHVKVLEFTAKRDAKKEVLDSLSDTLKALEERAAQVEPIIKFRSILSRASDILAKDSLPKEVSRMSISALNEKLTHYLDLINADFEAWISEDIEFLIRKPDGLEHAARRLSGGQKQQASIAYLLAVNDVFAGQLELLCLDEPTGALADENTTDMAEMMETLVRVGRETSRQFVIITHSDVLASYGEKIEL